MIVEAAINLTIFFSYWDSGGIMMHPVTVTMVEVDLNTTVPYNFFNIEGVEA